MKIVFTLPENDPRNPGVIADCTGDNAGDSVGPTADGFSKPTASPASLSAIISIGPLAGAIIPEFTKAFSSTESRHVKLD